MKNKICVYAISADEPKEFIDRWLESMKPADYIAVLVTKEGNPNYAYFRSKQAEYPNLIVGQKTISPWRFDTARNESMKLIPPDSDVLVCTDIDEILISEFWEDLRACVAAHPNFRRILYRYAWSHDSDGNPKWTFWYDKITRNGGWRWEYPVHEALVCDKNYSYDGVYRLDGDKIYLHHYPQEKASRRTYLSLLELRAKEYPEDLYGLYYLAREYSFINDTDSAVRTMMELYLRISKNPVKDDMRMLPSVCTTLGDYFRRLRQNDDAEFYYKRAIKADCTARDGYIKLAQLYAYTNRPIEAYGIIAEMETKTHRTEDWRLLPYMWRDWKKYQIIACAKAWQGKYFEAKAYIEDAQSDLKTEDDREDAYREGFYTDYEFILKKAMNIREGKR